MELIGNRETLAQIRIALKSAIESGRAIPHTLLTGVAGCGKTSTAKHLSKISNCDLRTIGCDSLKDRFDVAKLISQLNRKGYDDMGMLIDKDLIAPTIVFIDEIHNLSLAAQENLGIAMEEWYVPITEREADALKVQIDANQDYWSPQFTLVGATTNDGKLSKPFRERFKMRFVFTPYSFEESIRIIFVHAQRLKINIDREAAEEIAKRGRGVPRVMVGLLERCRDVAVAFNKKALTKPVAVVVFDEIGIDSKGFTKTDIELMKALHEIDNPVGLDNLATILNESPKVLSETVEPYLIQNRFILRSRSGRILTDKGREYLAKRGYIKKSSKFERIAISRHMDRGF